MVRGSGVIAWVLAFGVGVTLGRRLRRWLSSRDPYDGLDGVVSHSSRVIAAWRALETLQQDSLFSDPFAMVLAGEAAFRQALASAKVLKKGASTKPWGRRLQISNVASRVWWFDRQILAALSPPQPARLPAGAFRNARSSSSSGPDAQNGLEAGVGEEPIVEKAALASPRPSQQNVVVLGSGMDTRPWRLDLPAGVHWYEIDRQDVLDAKQRALRRMGVQFSGCEQPSTPAGVQYPLRASKWAAVEADLCSQGWTEKLRAAGFDPSFPTVWVAEGLLMYLTQADVEVLLREIAEVSAPGSSLVLHQVTDDLLQQLQRGPVEYPPFSQELMQTWHSSLPQDPSQVLEQAGWQMEQAICRAHIAHEICGGQPEGKCDFETRIGAERGRFAVFVVACK